MKYVIFNWRKPVIYFLLYLSGSKISQNLNEIKKFPFFSEEKIKKYQEKKLSEALVYAWKNVPYYNEILTKMNVVMDGKVNLNNFGRVPILTKDIIRKEKKNLFSKEKIKGVYENTSGGSIGEPARFLQDRHYDDWNIAGKIYTKTISGQSVGEKELRLWGSERDLLEGKESFKIRLRNWLYNRKEFNTFKMSEGQMEEYVIKWNKYKPYWVEAYVQSIYQFAKFIEKNKIKIEFPKNGICVSAGTVYPEIKDKIEEIFKCPVYNGYGSREVGGIAYGKSELKISFWHNHVEVLNEKLRACEAGKRGKIYITTLNNYSMPLIRYDIGDIGVMAEEWGKIKEVSGRETSLFKRKEKRGGAIHGAYFRHAIFFMDWIKKFQVVQKDYDLIVYKIVKIKEPPAKDLEKAENFVKKAMGKKCKVEWEFVEEIEPSKSGKHSYTISEVE